MRWNETSASEKNVWQTELEEDSESVCSWLLITQSWGNAVMSLWCHCDVTDAVMLVSGSQLVQFGLMLVSDELRAVWRLSGCGTCVWLRMTAGANPPAESPLRTPAPGDHLPEQTSPSPQAQCLQLHLCQPAAKLMLVNPNTLEHQRHFFFFSMFNLDFLFTNEQLGPNLRQEVQEVKQRPVYSPVWNTHWMILFNCWTVTFFTPSSQTHRRMSFSSPEGEFTLSWNDMMQLRGAVRTLRTLRTVCGLWGLWGLCLDSLDSLTVSFSPESSGCTYSSAPTNHVTSGKRPLKEQKPAQLLHIWTEFVQLRWETAPRSVTTRRTARWHS